MSKLILHIHELSGQTGYVEFADKENVMFNWRYWGKRDSIPIVIDSFNESEAVPVETEDDSLTLVEELPNKRDKDIHAMRRLMLELKSLKDVFSIKIYEKE